MTIARKHLIDYSQTCYYHCISRCIDQRFLLAKTAQYSDEKPHRQQWIEQRLLFLGDVFAIDVLAYSVMDNHIHSVIHANLKLAKSLSNIDVLKRWSRIGKIPLLCQVYLDSRWREMLSEGQLALVLEQVSEYRRKLTDISTFMSRLNSYIAHRANKEDGRKGHFWEGRFKSQALLDADAVLACMAYVDLNPLRVAKTRELNKSPHTSIKKRLLLSSDKKSTFIKPFRSNLINECETIVDKVTLSDYLSYIESAIGVKLNQDYKFDEFIASEDNWAVTVLEFEKLHQYAAGDPEFVSDFEKQIRAKARVKKDLAINPVLLL